MIAHQPWLRFNFQVITQEEFVPRQMQGSDNWEIVFFFLSARWQPSVTMHMKLTQGIAHCKLIVPFVVLFNFQGNPEYELHTLASISFADVPRAEMGNARRQLREHHHATRLHDLAP